MSEGWWKLLVLRGVNTAGCMYYLNLGVETVEELLGMTVGLKSYLMMRA